MINFPGLIHDIYYVHDNLNDKPFLPYASPWPTLVEFWAASLNAQVAESGRPAERFEIRIWTAPPPPIPLYAQRDPRWASEPLGFSNSTLGGYGCVITSLAMILSAIEKREILPPDVNAKLREVNGFAGQERNLVIWSKVAEAYPSIQFKGLLDCRQKPAPIQKIDRAVQDPDQYCIIQVDFQPDPAHPGIQTHYMPVVSCVERPLVSGNGAAGYLANDPWTGEQVTIPPAYCRPGWDAARAIYRVTYWSAA